jgi:CARDB
MTNSNTHTTRKLTRAVVLLALMALLATNVPLQPAGAAIRRPDLVVSVMTNPPLRVARGGSFALTTTVKNAGRAKAGPSTLRFYMSRDRAKSTSDKRFTQLRKVTALLPGKISKGKTTLKPSSTTAIGNWYVIACADDLKKVRESKETNNCKATRALEMIPGTSSSDRIDAAVEAGTITPEQGLIYQTFAAFGDSRLPAAYRGDDLGAMHGGDLSGVSGAFDTLSASARGTLIPFLMPPAYPGTWEELSTTSTSAAPAPRTQRRAGPTRSVSAVPPPKTPSLLGDPGWWFFDHANARIWFREDDAVHEAFAGELFEALNKVHPDLTTLMGKTPMSDAGPHPFVDEAGQIQMWGDGGSGALDIYVMHMGGKGGLTVAYPPDCTGRPSYMLINPRFDYPHHTTNARDILAHEFMHVLQYTYTRSAPCADYQNIDEATATWAIDYVYPSDNMEQDWSTYLWKNYLPSLAKNDYDGWNFFMYLEEVMSPNAISDIYAAMTSQDPWAAVDSVVTDGLGTAFPDFLRKAWNQIPENSNFVDWDGIGKTPALATDGAGGTGPRPVRYNQPFEMKMELQALGHAYYYLTFEDDDIVKIKFENALDGILGIDTHAFVKLADGTWRTEDWTNKDKVTFCRDKANEDVKELVIIVANSVPDLDNTEKATNKITTTGDCLPEKYIGSFSGAQRGVDMPEIPYETPLETWSGNVTFTRYTGTCNGEWWCFDSAYQAYTAEAGSGSWSANGGNPCNVTAGGSYALVPLGSGEEAVLVVRKRPDASHTYSTYKGSISIVETQPGTSHCEGEDPVNVDWTANIGWQQSQEFEANADGSLVGTDTLSPKNPYIYFSWNLTPAG